MSVHRCFRLVFELLQERSNPLFHPMAELLIRLGSRKKGASALPRLGV